MSHKEKDQNEKQVNTLTRDELQNRLRDKKKPPVICWNCGEHRATDVHHVNGNHRDNRPENLVPWCKRCHNEHHGISDSLTVLGITVRQFYSIQRVRVAMNNRIIAYEKLGYDVKHLRKFVEGETINTFTEIKIPGLRQIEEKLGETIAGMIEREPIYQAYLRHARGCGPLLSALLMSLIGDPGRFPTISSLWAYAGLDVADGKARRRKKGETSNWNHALRTAVVGMLVPQFIKLSGCFGRQLYDEYKAYYTERDGDTLPKIHIERRARRKVGKAFLSCLWVAWRRVKGLPVSNPYPIDKMDGHTHLITPEDWMENGIGAPLAYTQEMDLED